MDDKLLTTSELAIACGVSVPTIRNFRQLGLITPVVIRGPGTSLENLYALADVQKVTVLHNERITTGRILAAQANLSHPKLGHLVDMVCDYCGKTFVNYASHRQKPHKYCDRRCAGKASWGNRMESADIEPVPRFNKKQIKEDGQS